MSNTTGSATGDSVVVAGSGTLSGSGIIAGEVLVGNGIDHRGVIAPGAALGTTATLTIQSLLLFQPLGTYSCKLDTKAASADMIIANGVVIFVDSDVEFQLASVGNQRVALGTVFTVINNTDTGPINGVFTNLPDGGLVTAGRNTFQASYEGGDGNDMTLTVVE